MTASPTRTASTASAEEIDRFQALADSWWDSEGKFKPLHRFNPPRLAYLRDRLAEHFGRDPKAEHPFEGLTLLDIGCGGGLLSEPLARLGFTVTGIDAGDKTIGVARLHAAASGIAIDYKVATPEEMDGQFDVVLAMEVVEHVTDPALFLDVAARLLKPGGAFVAATMNRTLKALALAVVGAEYVLRWLPIGTHDWRKFLKPSELAGHMRKAGIEPRQFEGMRYDVVKDRWERHRGLDVNYLVYGCKP